MSEEISVLTDEMVLKFLAERPELLAKGHTPESVAADYAKAKKDIEVDRELRSALEEKKSDDASITTDEMIVAVSEFSTKLSSYVKITPASEKGNQNSRSNRYHLMTPVVLGRLQVALYLPIEE